MVALLVIDRRSQLPKLPCRYLLRGVVMGYLNSRFPKWAAVDAALSSEGWKLVTLLRLSPVVPLECPQLRSVCDRQACPCPLRAASTCSMQSAALPSLHPSPEYDTA